MVQCNHLTPLPFKGLNHIWCCCISDRLLYSSICPFTGWHCISVQIYLSMFVRRFSPPQSV